jgi:hypothetical protein
LTKGNVSARAIVAVVDLVELESTIGVLELGIAVGFPVAFVGRINLELGTGFKIGFAIIFAVAIAASIGLTIGPA